MKGAKPLAILLILSMLSACAGTDVRERHTMQAADEPGENEPTSYDEAIDPGAASAAKRDELRLDQSAVPAAHRAHRSDHEHARQVHYHDEPSPEARYAAEIAFILTAQVFVCSFVVVVLNGHCSLYASTGYYY